MRKELLVSFWLAFTTARELSVLDGGREEAETNLVRDKKPLKPSEHKNVVLFYTPDRPSL